MYDELVKRLRDAADWADHFAVLMGRDGDVHAPIMRKAADAIEELQKVVEKEQAFAKCWEEMATDCKDRFQKLLDAYPKWIPVTERLPLYGQDVLAVRTYGDGEKCQEVLMAHIAVWDEETGKKWWNATNITHWMPLPEPPKGE